MSQKIKVLIVDDHPLFRQGLRQVVENDSRFELVAEAGDGETALRLITEKKPAVAVLDVNLPALSGLEVARRLRDKVRRASLPWGAWGLAHHRCSMWHITHPSCTTAAHLL